jgi:endonuclease/exonuclease/phosphatase family metal-dependent hydrolase
VSFRRKSYAALAGAILATVFSLGAGVAHAQTLPAGPTGLRVVIGTATRMQIAWDAVPDVPSYRIHYSTAADFSSNLKGVTTTETTYVLPSLQPNTTYYFRVAGLNGTTLLTEWSVGSGTTKPLMKISVGTYNVHNPNRTNCTAVSTDPKDWCNRAPWVAYAIVTEGLNALGIQEAYQPEERRDLLDRVNARISGSDPYAMAPDLASPIGYDNRILYDTRVFTLVAAGGMQYRNQLTGEDTPRHLAWAKLRHRVTGVVVLFVTTHLQPGGGTADTVDALQWSELIAETDKRRAEVPAANYVVAAGDFNSTRYESPARYRIGDMKNHGYGDVLGQQYRTDVTSGARAQVRKDAWVNSGNDFDPIASHHSNPNHTENGYSVDWIFASNTLKVPLYREWVRWTSYPTTFALPIASDHHLVRATISQ